MLRSSNHQLSVDHSSSAAVRDSPVFISHLHAPHLNQRGSCRRTPTVCTQVY